ncbi:14652_t:CDS:2, partial [Racocetra fulgida]
ECLNVSYRHANILKAKALLRSPTIGIRYNYSIVDRNGVTTAQETRKFQLRFKTNEDFESCAGIIGRYISCKPILGNDSSVSSSTSNNELGISNQTQILSKVQTPFNNIGTMHQQITRSQREQSVTLTTRQESGQKEYNIPDSSSRSSASSSTSSFATTTDINSRPAQNQHNSSKIPTSTSSFATTTDINSRPAQNQHNSSKIPTSTTLQQQTSPIQNNNSEIHTLNQRPPSNDMNSSQKVVNIVNSFAFPNDDEELQAWIMNILKDPEYPQF